MYNGIGLQTARGSGTNGYVQTNKFFVRPKTSNAGFDSNKGYGADQGMAGLSKKPNLEILEHDRKRQIELKLVTLDDELSQQGFTDDQIAVRVAELRQKLESEAAAISAASGDASLAMVLSDAKMSSDTQTHQVAARKEKQMEKMRAAFGITTSDVDAIKQGKGTGLDVDGPKDTPRSLRKDNFDNDGSEREEGEFFSGDEDLKIDKHQQDEVKSKKKEGKKKKKNRRKDRRGSLSSDSDSESMEESSESDSDRDSKRKPKPGKISRIVVRDDTSGPDSGSDEPYRGRINEAEKYSRAPKRHDSGSESESSRSSGHRTRKSKCHVTEHKDDSDSDSDRWKRKRTSDGELVTDSYKSKTKGDDYARKHVGRHDLDSDDELYYDRWKPTSSPDRVLATDSYKVTTKGDDYDRKHEDKYPNRPSKSYTDIRSDSGRGTQSERVAHDRSEKSRRFDKYELDRAGVEEKKLTVRRGRYDSESDDSDIERNQIERVQGIKDQKGYRTGKEENITRNDKEADRRRQDKVDNEYIYRKRDVEKDGREHKRQERKEEEEEEHVGGKDGKTEEDVSHKRKPESQMSKSERIEDEYKNKKRERKEENDGRDVKRERKEEDKDGGTRREKMEVEEHGGKTREMREENDRSEIKRERREEDKDGGRRGRKREDDQQGRTKEPKDRNVRRERREDEKDGGSKDTGKREQRGEDGQLGKMRETEEGYTHAKKADRQEEDERIRKKRERQDEDKERVGKRERRDDDAHGSRNPEKSGIEIKEKDRFDRKNRKEEEHGGRRFEDKDSCQRYRSDDVQRRR